MPVSKLKNLILMILALAAAFLLALVVPMRLSQVRGEARLHEQLEQLFVSYDVQLRAEQLPTSRQLCVVESSGMQAAASDAASALLGQAVLLEEDSTRYALHYTAANGQCSFEADGRFSAHLTGILADGAPRTHAQELLRRMGYSCATLTQQTLEDGGVLLTATQAVLDVPVLSGSLRLRYNASGALTDMEGDFFTAQEVLRVGDSTSCSCADALVALLSRRDALGWVGGSITDVQQGFYRTEAASGARLTPVWRIDTDAGAFYVSGISREVTLADAGTSAGG